MEKKPTGAPRTAIEIKGKTAPLPHQSAALSPAAAWVDRNIGLAIIGASAFGLVCVVGVMSAYHHWCDKDDPGLCLLAAQSPPWVLIAGLAAAPAVLLTWYWRTTQRKRELDLKQEELRQKDRDHQDAVDARGQQMRATVNSELTTFEREMLTDDLVRAAMIVSQAERLLQEHPDVLERVLQVIAQGVCHHSRVHHDSEIDIQQFRFFAGKAMRLLGQARTSQELALRLSLRGARLHGLDLRGLDLRNLDFHGARLSNLQLHGADLSGSTFAGAIGGYGIEFDESTKMDDTQRPHLELMTRTPPHSGSSNE